MAEHGTGTSVGSELELARRELAALEGALEELPQILEDKFRQRLLALRQINHQLQLEQASLKTQLMASPRPMGPPWRPVLLVALACTALAGLGWGAARQLGYRTGYRTGAIRQPPLNSERLPPAAAPLSNSVLQVQAQGSSWVEVQDLRSHAVLFIGVLEAGQSRTIRLRQGLRLRSGRPDLLTIRIDDGSPQPFGLSHGQDWRTVMPPAFRTAGG
ncbi:MAG: hypothetical protein RLZZ336_1197 [Cyanobacteriota bacterium]